MTDPQEPPARLLRGNQPPSERHLARSAGKAGGSSLRPRREIAQLSFSQKRIWFLEQLNPGTATYNAAYAFRVRGALDRDAFRRAVNGVIERHAVLRTTIAPAATGEPCGRVLSEWDSVGTVCANASGSQEETAQSLMAEFALKPFDLTRDLMMRTTVIVIDGENSIILFTVHHIAWDGISKEIFFREVGSLYDSYITGGRAALPPLAIDYADYALWQERSFSGATRDAEISYWKARLAGAPPYLDVPLDKPRPAIQRFRGAKVPVVPAPQLMVAAKDFSRGEKVTLFATVLAAFRVFLLAFTAQEDISISTPFAGRDLPETWELIGLFTNTVILRARIAGRESFREILGREWDNLLSAQDHQQMPMDLLVEIVNPPRDLSRMPLAQVNFRFQANRTPMPRLRGLDLAPLPLIDTLVSKFDLALDVAAPEGEAGHLEYNTDLFDDDRMRRIPELYEALLADLISDPGKPVAELEAFQAAGRLPSKRRRLQLPAMDPGTRRGD